MGSPGPCLLRSMGPRTAYKDYYRILQVHPLAEEEVIQAAYRRLARLHHPDAGAEDTRTMQELNEAYEVLSNPEQRVDFDRWYQSEHANVDVEPPPIPLWRAMIPVLLSLTVLVVLILDLWRLGLRGVPEVTLVLVAVGWLVYHFGGLRNLWR